jgi:hypothetical protein
MLVREVWTQTVDITYQGKLILCGIEHAEPLKAKDNGCASRASASTRAPGSGFSTIVVAAFIVRMFCSWRGSSSRDSSPI